MAAKRIGENQLYTSIARTVNRVVIVNFKTLRPASFWLNILPHLCSSSVKSTKLKCIVIEKETKRRKNHLDDFNERCDKIFPY